MECCVLIKGRVQGVGFRYWVKCQAMLIGGIDGYAMNLDNGDVAVLMRGDEKAVNSMLQKLHEGPLWSRVDSITIAPEYKTYFPPVLNGVFKRI